MNASNPLMPLLSLALLLFAIATTSLAIADTPLAKGFSWERLADLPQGVVRPAAAISGHYLVVTGGLVMGGEATDRVQIMDMDTQQWVASARLHQKRFHHAQVSLKDGRILIAGGRDRNSDGVSPLLRSCEMVDLTQPQPIQKIANLPEPMGTPTLHLLDDGRVVAIGNRIAAIYDPTNDQWIVITRLVQPRNEHVSLMLGPGHILVIGGTGRRTLETIDLEQQRSRYYRNVHLPVAVDDAAAVLLPDGRVWLTGGQQLNGQTLDQTWLVDFTNQLATEIESGPSLGLPEGISDHVLVQTRYGLVLAGGESQNAQKHDVELATTLLLNPMTLTFQRLPDLSVPQDDAAGVAWEGTVIILGGMAPGSVLGVEVPTPVRAVHRLIHEDDP